MKIPKTVRLLGFDYAIELCEDSQRDKNNYNFGQADMRFQKITIDKRQAAAGQEQTLLHEILEVLNYELQLELPHNKLMSLAGTFYAVLRDNRMLR